MTAERLALAFWALVIASHIVALVAVWVRDRHKPHPPGSTLDFSFEEEIR